MSKKLSEQAEKMPVDAPSRFLGRSTDNKGIWAFGWGHQTQSGCRAPSTWALLSASSWESPSSSLSTHMLVFPGIQGNIAPSACSLLQPLFMESFSRPCCWGVRLYTNHKAHDIHLTDTESVKNGSSDDPPMETTQRWAASSTPPAKRTLYILSAVSGKETHLADHKCMTLKCFK